MVVLCTCTTVSASGTQTLIPNQLCTWQLWHVCTLESSLLFSSQGMSHFGGPPSIAQPLACSFCQHTWVRDKHSTHYLLGVRLPLWTQTVNLSATSNKHVFPLLVSTWSKRNAGDRLHISSIECLPTPFPYKESEIAMIREESQQSV